MPAIKAQLNSDTFLMTLDKEIGAMRRDIKIDLNRSFYG